MRVPVLAASLAGSVVLGALAGLVWSHVAAQPPPGGLAGLDPYAPEAETLIAADGWFAVVGGVAGVVSGVLGWVRRAGHALPQLAALAGRLVVGGVLGSAVAWGVGVWTASPLTIHATAVLLVWPIAALVTVIGAVATAEDAWHTDGGSGQRWRAMGATEAPVTRTRSAGSSSRSRPRRPPDTRTVSW